MLALQSEWRRLHRARNGAITASGFATPPTNTALDASASAFRQKATKLYRDILNEIRSYRSSKIYAPPHRVGGGGEKRPTLFWSRELPEEMCPCRR